MRAAFLEKTRLEFDVTLQAGGDSMGEVSHRYLFLCSYMVDLQMCAKLLYQHNPINQVLYITEAASLLARALNGERNGAVRMLPAKALHANDKLGDDVLPPHVTSIDIMRTVDYDSLKMFATKVDGQQFADDLATAIGITGVHGIRHNQRRVFGGWDPWGSLINLRAGCQK